HLVASLSPACGCTPQPGRRRRMVSSPSRCPY
ncbi:hypothetical protein HaLaN_28041, partial [Haematococcus lacustris]